MPQTKTNEDEQRNADVEKAEIDLLREALKRSYKRKIFNGDPFV